MTPAPTWCAGSRNTNASRRPPRTWTSCRAWSATTTWYVELDGERYDIRARIHTLGGYSAHADQQNLLDFIGAMNPLPREVILVHGEAGAKRALQMAIEARFSGVKVRIP